MSQDYAAHTGVTAPADTVVEATALYPLFTRLAAEAFGTFILVLGIIATGAFAAVNQNATLFVALVGGALVAAGMTAVGHVSGGHFNPAITFGTALAGRTAWKDVLPYWLAQFVGAAVAAVVVWALIPAPYASLLGLSGRGDVLARTGNGWGAHSPLSTVSQGQGEFTLVHALLIEVIIAAVLVGIWLAVTSKRSRFTYPGAVIGLTLGALYIVSWPITNGSFSNPARTFASALFSGDSSLWKHSWLFLVGPLVGAALAALCYRAFAPATVVVGEEALDELEETYAVAPVAYEPEPEFTQEYPVDAAPAEDVVEAEAPEAPEAPKAPRKPEEPQA
ncbi:MIP/aquaporin family protein [Xylanimonas sp. McL0601]|uniref:MIP/aquaporin family protein n=1 Tax=Xylanimonas sp. McL0601 TaxID=3414739 RepID=UPI003CF60279